MYKLSIFKCMAPIHERSANSELMPGWCWGYRAQRQLRGEASWSCTLSAEHACCHSLTAGILGSTCSRCLSAPFWGVGHVSHCNTSITNCSPNHLGRWWVITDRRRGLAPGLATCGYKLLINLCAVLDAVVIISTDAGQCFLLDHTGERAQTCRANKPRGVSVIKIDTIFQFAL